MDSEAETDLRLRRQLGWVEQSETHRHTRGQIIGLAVLYPSYGLDDNFVMSRLLMGLLTTGGCVDGLEAETQYHDSDSAVGERWSFDFRIMEKPIRSCRNGYGTQEFSDHYRSTICVYCIVCCRRTVSAGRRSDGIQRPRPRISGRIG